MNSETLIQTIPSYTPSAPAPSYSADPHPDEKCLEFVPRRSGRRLPQGTFTRSNKTATISLHRQEDEVVQPTYGSQAHISGQVSVHRRIAVTKIELRLLGRLELATEISGFVKQTVKKSFILWEGQKGACPGEIAFGHHLPASFEDGDVRRALPPSLRINVNADSNIYAKSDYFLICIITSEKIGGLLSSRSQIRIPFKYYPRTRPPRSLISSTLMSSLKAQPEEWTQLSSVMSTKQGSGIEPLQCHFLMPSVKIYGISDVVPFHIQLRGSLPSLRELYGPDKQGPKITVEIVRQITIKFTDGQKRWKDIVVGSGTLNAVPPPVSAQDITTAEGYCLDWEGEMQCDGNMNVGGFDCGPLMIRDFVVLRVIPAIPRTSQLLDHAERQMIKLVTNSWEDQASYRWDEWP